MAPYRPKTGLDIEPKPCFGVIAGKKLDTNEYVVIIPDIPLSSIQKKSADVPGLRPFEGYNLPSVGSERPASRSQLFDIGISNDIINNVYDSQLYLYECYLYVVSTHNL